MKRRKSASKADSGSIRKASKRAAENAELEYIENLLGEDFESLSQARHAMSREVSILKTPKKVKKPEPEQRLITKFKLPVSSRQKAYTIKELNPNQRKSVKDFMRDKQYTSQLDKQLLKPREYFAAEVPYVYKGSDGKRHVGYSRTYNLYTSSRAMFGQMGESGDNHTALITSASDSFLKTIRIVKYTGKPAEWKGGKKQEKTDRKEMFKQINKTLKEKESKRAQRKNKTRRKRT